MTVRADVGPLGSERAEVITGEEIAEGIGRGPEVLEEGRENLAVPLLIAS